MCLILVNGQNSSLKIQYLMDDLIGNNDSSQFSFCKRKSGLEKWPGALWVDFLQKIGLNLDVWNEELFKRE